MKKIHNEEFPKFHYVHFLRMIKQRISTVRQSKCTHEQLHTQHLNSSITRRQYVKDQSPSSSTVKRDLHVTNVTAAACSYSRWLWVSFTGISQTWNITETVLEYKEMGIQYTRNTIYNWPHITCQGNVKIVRHSQELQSLQIPNSHICLKIPDHNMLLNIFNNSYKITYDLSGDLQVWRFIPFTTPRSNHMYHLADSSDHFLWCSSPFWGRGLPAAKVSRQPSSYNVKMTAPQTNPILEGQGFSLFLAPCSKPVWQVWPYQQLWCRRHCC